ncbi:hypothetical protein BDV98DRAFT_561477 [Pterulicium gracile]|uniref:F-box domain-containing protein n=1 Tax=Pterulicium gracile TaxID=1884261 RepID=A0A5C3QUM1_9AGAR|nr:hypothetical protein BDV98DRAFT_561477 [Pterula gracilis]
MAFEDDYWKYHDYRLSVHLQEEPLPYIAHPPWNLAATSTQWRAACLSTPKLWTRLQTSVHRCVKTAGICTNSLDTRCSLSLERWRGLPLVVDGLNVRCPSQISYLRIAATQCHRWAGWRINFEDIQGRDPLEDIMKESRNLGALRTLRYDGMQFHNHNFSLPFDCATLRPENIILNARFEGDPHPSTNFSWFSVKTVVVPNHYGSMEDIFGLLRECPRLERFSLAMDDCGNAVIQPGQPAIALEYLTFLDLDSCVSALCELSLMQTPALRTVYLHSADIRLMGALTASPSRSGCSLESLSIPFTDRIDLAYFFSSMPTLQELALSGGPIRLQFDTTSLIAAPKDMLKKLTREEQRPCLLPRLKFLRLQYIPFEPTLLGEVIASRSTLPEDKEHSPSRRVDVFVAGAWAVREPERLKSTATPRRW